MARKIIVKGADFEENALEKPYSKVYYYNIPKEQYRLATGTWIPSSMGFGATSQTAIQGKTLHGVRLMVDTAGTLTIYKASAVTVNNANALTEVATITATRTGLQDLDFSSPISLGANEVIVFGCSTKGQTSLLGKHSKQGDTASVTQNFYTKIGQATPTLNSSIALNADFYTIVPNE